MSTYRTLSIPEAPPAWRWTRPRVADALGLWRWPWGRRWGVGRWAVRSVVTGAMSAAEWRSAVAAYYGDPGAADFAVETWLDAETVRWRPTAECPCDTQTLLRACSFDGKTCGCARRACTCEVYP